MGMQPIPAYYVDYTTGTFYLAPTYILNTTGSLEMLCFSEVIS